ncbi:MAG: alkane 1-monooxygenase [Planctomycetota bacterium]
MSTAEPLVSRRGRRVQRALHPGGLGFLATYLIPLLIVVSAQLGAATRWPNSCAWLPLLVAYVAIPALNFFWRGPQPGFADTVRGSAGWQRYYRALLLLSVAGQVALLVAGASFWASGLLAPLGQVGWLMSVGLFSSLFAINVGHELIHSRHSIDRAVGGVLLSMVCFGTFKTVHLAIHHRYVGTPLDHATAPRGRSLYGHWWRSVRANSWDALCHERRRLAQSGTSWWRSELVASYALSALWLALSATVWGWAGAVFFVLQSALAIVHLEWLNYLQHYGLSRARRADGRYEPVRPQHSWSQEHTATNLATFNLMRHGDHHAHAWRRYQDLRHQPDSPSYPFDFSIMLLVALCPPAFRAVAHARLERAAPRHQEAR